MKTFDDKSEGKTSNRPKNNVHKYLILGISFGEKIQNFCIIIVCCYSTFSDFLLNFYKKYLPKKMQRIEQNKNKKFF